MLICPLFELMLDAGRSKEYPEGTELYEFVDFDGKRFALRSADELKPENHLPNVDDVIVVTDGIGCVIRRIA